MYGKVGDPSINIKCKKKLLSCIFGWKSCWFWSLPSVWSQSALCCQLPLWLKQELADSEAVNDGNEADATSGEDSSAVASKSSTGSIHINVHLKQGQTSTLANNYLPNSAGLLGMKVYSERCIQNIVLRTLYSDIVNNNKTQYKQANVTTILQATHLKWVNLKSMTFVSIYPWHIFK